MQALISGVTFSAKKSNFKALMKAQFHKLTETH